MKKSFSLLSFLLVSLIGFCQSPDLSGEWVGIMSIDVNRTQQNVFVNFSLQIEQSGQAIWAFIPVAINSVPIPAIVRGG